MKYYHNGCLIFDLLTLTAEREIKTERGRKTQRKTNITLLIAIRENTEKILGVATGKSAPI